MNILKAGFIKDFIKIADDGYKMGWHECNGGNLSYRLREEDIELLRFSLEASEPWINIGTRVPDLAGDYLAITGAGSFFRNISLSAYDNIGIIQINDRGDAYRLWWGLASGRGPTSELASHLMIHSVKKRANKDGQRVLYHCHPVNLIALSFVLPLSNKVFTRELWEMMPECPLVFPEGLGLVEWMLPGSLDLALATSQLMEKYNGVIWAHHGLICSGEDFDASFGLAHTIEKAAQILVKVLSMDQGKVQRPRARDLKALSDTYKLKLGQEFLIDND